MELLEKYGDSDDAETIITKEMGWDHENELSDSATEMSAEELNALCDAAIEEQPPNPNPEHEGIDWIRSEDGRIKHPLQYRCAASALDHLDKSQAGLEAVGIKKLLAGSVTADARKELFEIRQGILTLMDRFRGRS